jgi:hypothetical protein
MYQTHHPADIRSAAPIFNVTWRTALKSARLAHRRPLIAAVCRHSPLHYQQIDLVLAPPARRSRLAEAAGMGNAAEEGRGFQAVRCEGRNRNQSEWRVTGHDH